MVAPIRAKIYWVLFCAFTNLLLRLIYIVAQKYGVAMTSVDCHEDLVRVDENDSSQVLVNRERLKRILTPQTFSFGLIKSLFENVNLDTETATSMFILYLKSGGTVHCSEGNSKNIKLTYSSDIEYFRNLFKE